MNDMPRSRKLDRQECLSYLFSDGGFRHRLPKRRQASATERLDETHHAHVAKAEKEEEQERHRTPHAHTRGVKDGEEEINREAQLQQWQQSAFTFVLFALPSFVMGFFYLVFGSTNEVALNSKQRFQHGARIGKCQTYAQRHYQRQMQ